MRICQRLRLGQQQVGKKAIGKEKVKPEALSPSGNLQPAVGVVLVLRQKVAHIDLMVKYILVDREVSHLTKSFPSPRLRLVFIMAFIHRSQVAWIHIMSPQICALLICLHIQLHIELHIQLHIELQIH